MIKERTATGLDVGENVFPQLLLIAYYSYFRLRLQNYLRGISIQF